MLHLKPGIPEGKEIVYNYATMTNLIGLGFFSTQAAVKLSIKRNWNFNKEKANNAYKRQFFLLLP